MSHYDLHHSESTITELRAQLAAAESKVTGLEVALREHQQQLTTATALLGECDDLLDNAIDLIENAPCTDLSKCEHSGCRWTHKADAVLTRIREATKGKT